MERGGKWKGWRRGGSGRSEVDPQGRALVVAEIPSWGDGCRRLHGWAGGQGQLKGCRTCRMHGRASRDDMECGTFVGCGSLGASNLAFSGGYRAQSGLNKVQPLAKQVQRVRVSDDAQGRSREGRCACAFLIKHPWMRQHSASVGIWQARVMKQVQNLTSLLFLIFLTSDCARPPTGLSIFHLKVHLAKFATPGDADTMQLASIRPLVIPIRLMMGATLAGLLSALSTWQMG